MKTVAAMLAAAAVAACLVGCSTTGGANMVKIESVELVSAPLVLTPNPVGLAARVSVDPSAFDSPVVAELLGGAKDAWLVIGCSRDVVAE